MIIKLPNVHVFLGIFHTLTHIHTSHLSSHHLSSPFPSFFFLLCHCVVVLTLLSCVCEIIFLGSPILPFSSFFRPPGTQHRVQNNTHERRTHCTPTHTQSHLHPHTNTHLYTHLYTHRDRSHNGVGGSTVLALVSERITTA